MSRLDYLNEQSHLLQEEIEFLVEENEKIKSLKSDLAVAMETCVMNLAVKVVHHKLKFIANEIESEKSRSNNV